jgi:type IV pilus assembly protein PilY1
MNVNSMRPLAGSANTTGTHRGNFVNFVNSIRTGGGTPTHRMFSQADAYMRRPLTANSPWAKDPGNTAAPYLGCRRNYHIVMTDGRWNGTPFTGGARDNALSQALPDGQVYGGATVAARAQTNLYRDTATNTLADWAFNSWANPLQTSGLTGSLTPSTAYTSAAATESFGVDSTGAPAVLDKYWNPRYDPATWPHMVTYTIGFSQAATTWPGAPTITAPTTQVPFGYDGSFPDFVTANRTWPDMVVGGEAVRSLDLWHAALNGRGRFYAVTRGQDLERAFREIIGQISSETASNLSSTAASGSNSSRNDVGTFTSAYEPNKFWKGFVQSSVVKSDGSFVSNPGWNGKTTADLIDVMSPSDRVIMSWSDQWVSGKFKGGVAFRWAGDETYLSAAQKLWLQANPLSFADEGVTAGQNRLAYIRGDRSMEGTDPSGYTATDPYRERKSAQGDIVNSSIWYTGAPSSGYALKGYTSFVAAQMARTKAIYVGGNDGMLHGFSSANGAEILAYVPRGVIPGIGLLTDPTYNQTHKYFVDGSPMTGDVDMGAGVQDPDEPGYSPTYAPDWRTLLVGTLGGGGKGYFVLDVTNPSAFSEANASTLVKLDRTRGNAETAPNCADPLLSIAEQALCTERVDQDKDIGNITAVPVLDENNAQRTSQIVRMNNNKWAVIMGNGYNSTNQRPVLLIQYLDQSMKLVRIQATTDATGSGNAVDNGLMAPRVMDVNGDGRIDVAYAGDNLGNMWKFDLTSVTETDWKVAFSGSPLFTARGPAVYGSPSRTKVQPITAPPTLRANDRKMTNGTDTTKVGGLMVTFGTGRNASEADTGNTNVQTLYSVLDNTRYKVVTTALGKRLEVNPGSGTCPWGTDCVPVPTPLGTGVTTAKLAQQKISTVSGANGTVVAVDDLNINTWSNFNGWYLDFSEVGERLLKSVSLYDNTNILTVYSQVPEKGSNSSEESCDPVSATAEKQYRTFINAVDGKVPTFQIVDMNADGAYNAADLKVVRTEETPGGHVIVSDGKYNKDIDNQGQSERLAPPPEIAMRPSWRQVK